MNSSINDKISSFTNIIPELEDIINDYGAYNLRLSFTGLSKLIRLWISKNYTTPPEKEQLYEFLCYIHLKHRQNESIQDMIIGAITKCYNMYHSDFCYHFYKIYTQNGNIGSNIIPPNVIPPNDTYDTSLIDEVLKNINNRKGNIVILKIILKKFLYTEFDFFVSIMDQENSILRKKKIEQTKYHECDLLNHKKVPVDQLNSFESNSGILFGNPQKYILPGLPFVNRSGILIPARSHWGWLAMNRIRMGLIHVPNIEAMILKISNFIIGEEAPEEIDIVLPEDPNFNPAPNLDGFHADNMEIHGHDDEEPNFNPAPDLD
jgi:hypothetical protein